MKKNEINLKALSLTFLSVTLLFVISILCLCNQSIQQQKKYMRFVEATDSLIHITITQDDYFIDVITESDSYQDFLEARDGLR